MNIFDHVESEKETLDLNNPIFVFYINIDGLSRQRADEEMAYLMNNHQYTNVKIWWMPTTTSPTRIECVYDGGYKKRKTELTDLIKQINTRIDVLSNSSTFEDFKIQIRDWRLDNILEDNGDNKK